MDRLDGHRKPHVQINALSVEHARRGDSVASKRRVSDDDGQGRCERAVHVARRGRCAETAARVSVVARLAGTLRTARLRLKFAPTEPRTDERCMQPMHAIQAFATSFTSTEFPGCTRRPGRSCCTAPHAGATGRESSDGRWSCATARRALCDPRWLACTPCRIPPQPQG